MTGRPALCGITALGLLFLSCTGDGVRRSLDDPAAVPADTILTSVTLSIGAVEGPEDAVIGRVFSGFMRDDRIFIANGIVPEIREYDRAGRLVRRIGRGGMGPGEFRNLRWIAPLRPDSLIALDLLASRVTVFDANGSYARSFHLHVPEYGQAEWISAHGAGLAIGFSHGLDPRRMSAVARDSFSIAFVPRDPEERQALEHMLPSIGGRWWRRTSPGGLAAIEDGPSPVVAIRNGVVLATTAEVHSVRRWTGAAWDEIPLIDHRWSNGHVRGTDIPLRLYEQLVAAPDGRFWLADFTVGGDGFRMWRVFSSNGRLESILRLPRGFRVFQVGEDFLLGRRLTDDGVEYVELLQLVS